MRSHELNETHPRKTARRVGRGISAGQGKTAGRGTKGQKARTGFNIPRTFDGGAANFIQRLPKLKGFKSHREKPTAVTVATLQRHFDSGTTLTLESLVEKGIVSANEALRGVKIIGSVEGYEFSLTEGQNLTATRSRN